jgi:hypothetical protein
MSVDEIENTQKNDSRGKRIVGEFTEIRDN